MIDIVREGEKHITYDIKNDHMSIHNHYENDIKIEFINKELNFGGWITRINLNMFTVIDLNIEQWKNRDIIITIAIKNYCYVFYFNGISKKLDISRNKSKKLPLIKDPIILTGHSGGGTSIVFKLLVSRGLYRGTDGGNFNRRKPLESVLIRAMLNGIIDRETSEDVNKNIEKYTELFKNNISDYFDRFWGDENINSTWGFKKPDMFFTTLILSNMFKNAKFLSVVKKQKGKHASKEGNDFLQSEKDDVINQQRPLIEGNQMFHINYEKFFEDYHYVNKVLRFCGLREIQNEEDYKETLNYIKYDR